MLKFNERNLEATAKAVLLTNKYAVGYSVAEMESKLRQVAAETFNDAKGFTGYVRTYGFVLTGWLDENGAANVVTSIDSESVLDSSENKG